LKNLSKEIIDTLLSIILVALSYSGGLALGFTMKVSLPSLIVPGAGPPMILSILLTNMMYVVVSYVGGAIALVPSLISSSLLGLASGALLAFTGKEFIIIMLSHGFLEHIGLLLSSYAGIVLFLNRKHTSIFDRIVLKLNMLLISIIVVLLAAIIETLITPILVIILSGVV